MAGLRRVKQPCIVFYTKKRKGVKVEEGWPLYTFLFVIIVCIKNFMRNVTETVAGNESTPKLFMVSSIIARAPLLAYLAPGRYAEVSRTFAFPFHAGWSR